MCRERNRNDDRMKDFAAIDFETANGRPSSICSVGLVVVRGGEIVERLHRLIRPTPNYYYRFFTEQIHSICAEDTDDAPLFPEVWNAEVAPLIGRLPLVAHNAAFDERALRAAYEAYEMDYPAEYRFYCTLRAARRLFPKAEIGNHRLPTVCAWLGIPFEDHHQALADAEGCARIAMRIL